MIASYVIAGALALVMFGLPVAYALLLPALCYLIFYSPVPVVVAVQQMVSSVDGYTLLAVPLFLLVGSLAGYSGIGDRIFASAQVFVGSFRAGLGYVNVLTSFGFSWMSGAAISDAAVMGKVIVPQMQRRGYSDRFTAGITASAAMIAPTMPPSIPAVIFGVVSGISIGGLFLAAVVPAFLLTFLLCVYVWFYGRGRPDLTMPRPTLRELVAAGIDVLPALFAPVIVVGGIISGFFTPTEAAGVATAYLLLLGLTGYGRISLRGLGAALADSGRAISSIMILLATSMVFSWVLTVEQMPMLLAALARGWTDNPIVFMVLTIAVLFVLGTFVEPGPAIMVVTPVLVPVAEQFGIPLLQYGFLVIFVLLIGLYTPPVGIVLFVIQSVTNISARDVFLGVLPGIGLFLLLAVLVVLFPPLTLWLPSVLMN